MLRYANHKHFYRIVRRWHHPRGYLMQCHRCSNAGLYPFKFWRL